MSLKDCLQKKINSKLVSESEGKRVVKNFEDAVSRYTKSMGDADAAVRAALDVANLETKRLIQKKRNLIRHAQFQKQIMADLMVKSGLDPGHTGKPPADYQQGAFSKNARAFYDTVLDRKDTLAREALQYADGFVEQFRGKFAGLVQDVDNILPVVREIYDERTGIKGAEIYGRSLKKVFNFTLDRYRAAGGIAENRNKFFPQVHNPDQLRKVPFETWEKEILQEVKVNEMIDWETGLPFTPSRLRSVMRNIYDDVDTRNGTKLQRHLDSGHVTDLPRRGMAERRADARFFVFKDADAFLRYNRKYGNGDAGLYDMFINYVTDISHDTALMEKMGPRPDSVHNLLRLRTMAWDGEPQGGQKTKLLNGYYQVLSGLVARSAGESNWSYLWRGLLSLQRGSLLGGAAQAAIGDLHFAGVTSRANGLPVVRTLDNYFKQLNPANPKHRKMAHAQGFIAELAHSNISADVRFTGENFGGAGGSFKEAVQGTGNRFKDFERVTAWMSGFTNRASGLQSMTDAMKQSISLSLNAELAITRGTPWEKIDPSFKRAMQMAGLTEGDWKVIGKAKPSKIEGVEFLRGQDVMDLADVDPRIRIDIHRKLEDWHSKIRREIVNEPGLMSSAISTGAAFVDDARADTFARNFVSTSMMFMTFPITVTINHVLPGLMQPGVLNKGRALGSLWLGTMLLGAVALQSKELSKGRNALPWDNPRFWMASSFQGGGLGFFGDYLFSDTNRYGIKSDLPGPLGMSVSMLKKATLGNAQKFVQGKDTSFMKDMVRFIKHNTPAHTLWYARLGLDRFLWDHLERMADSNYDRNIMEMERKREREFGNKFWWRPGETTPEILQ